MSAQDEVLHPSLSLHEVLMVARERAEYNNTGLCHGVEEALRPAGAAVRAQLYGHFYAIKRALGQHSDGAVTYFVPAPIAVQQMWADYVDAGMPDDYEVDLPFSSVTSAAELAFDLTQMQQQRMASGMEYPHVRGIQGGRYWADEYGQLRERAYEEALRLSLLLPRVPVPAVPLEILGASNRGIIHRNAVAAAADILHCAGEGPARPARKGH